MARQRFKRGGSYTTTAATSARMARVRQKGTTPELIVRRALTGLGVRYRLNNRDLPGSPDIANRRARWAVFVHGCYWHRHAGCVRASTPNTNRAFWLAKFAANIDRDRRVTRALIRDGYRVITIWECEVERPSRLRVKLAVIAP